MIDSPDRQRGIALMLVMWVLTLLTVMAVSLTAAQRTETALTDNHVSAARFRALSDAAIAYAALNFQMQPPESEEETPEVWLPDGIPRSWRFSGTELEIAVFNEMSRIDLNQADPELLAALLVALDVPEDQAEELAAAIVDWRDDDDLALLNGAEDGDYKQTGLSFGAKDAPFESVEELRQVLGMTEYIYRRLAQEVMVAGASTTGFAGVGSATGGGGTLVEAFASPAVLAAYQGITLEDAQQQVADRDSTTVPGAEGPRAVDRGGPLYHIQVAEKIAGQRGRRMEAVVEIMPGQQPPYLVHWRRFGIGDKGPVTPSLDEG